MTDKATNTDGRWTYTIEGRHYESPSAAMFYLVNRCGFTVDEASEMLSSLPVETIIPEPRTDVSAAKRASVIEKVQRLLALSNSDNPNEAASAAALAAKLMAEYDIEEAVMAASEGSQPEPEEGIEAQDFRDICTWKRKSVWKDYLIVHLCRSMGCFVYFTYVGKGEHTYRVVGQPRHIATARYMFLYLVSEIERLVKRFAAGQDFYDRGEARVWHRTFKEHAANTVGRRMEDAAREAVTEARERLAGDCTALVAIEEAAMAPAERQAAAKAWVEAKYGKMGRARQNARRNTDWSAAEAGRAAGRAINIGGNKGLNG